MPEALFSQTFPRPAREKVGHRQDSPMGQAILRWFGIAYVVVGLLAFVAHDGRGYEFGVLNVNVPHSAIHIAVGLLSILASTNVRWTRFYGWFGLVSFVLLVIDGLVPAINPLAWWVPLDGPVLWFHVLTLAVFIAIVITTQPGKTAALEA